MSRQASDRWWSSHPPSLLVGREHEQTLLREALETARSGHGRVVLVSGEAGIGKTALIEDLTVGTSVQDCLTLIGRSYDLTTTPPYGPWIEALRFHQSDDVPPLLGFVDDPETATSLHSQVVLFEQTWRFFAHLAHRHPIILVLEDLHWADQASLDLLRYIGRQVPGHRLLLVVSYRDDEVTRRHPLFRQLPPLIRESAAERVELRQLDAGSVHALVSHRYHLDKGDQQRLVSYLQSRAEGNPLYLHELLRTLEVESILRQTDESWVVGDLSGVPVPRLVQQVIEGRTALLDKDTQRLLQIAAVIGQNVPVALWRAVSDAEEECLAQAMEQAEASHVITKLVGNTAYRFSHALVREAVYDGIGSLRRLQWHRRTAEVMIQQGQPDPDEVAYHFQQADDARAADWLINAGERAQQIHDWAGAADRFDAALPLLARMDAAPGDLGWLLLRVAQLRRFIGPIGGQTYLAEAARLAEEAGDRVLIACVLICKGAHLFYTKEIRRGLADMAEAMKIVDAMSLAEQSELVQRIETTGIEWTDSLVAGFALAGHFAEAQRFAQHVVAKTVADDTMSGRDLTPDDLVAFGLGLVRAADGQPDQALRHFARWREVMQARKYHVKVGLAALYELLYVVLPYRTDSIALRNQLAAHGDAAWLQTGTSLQAWPSRAAYLPLLFIEGQWNEVRHIATAAAAARGGTSPQRPVHLALLAQVAWAQGEVTQAWEYIREVFPDGPQTEPGDVFYFAALALQRLAVTLNLDCNDLVEARAWLEAHDDWLAWTNAFLGQAENRLLWACYHQEVGDLSQARHHGEQALMLTSDPRQPLALLVAHRFLGLLDATAGNMIGAEQHLQDSLALAETCCAPFERALTLTALARLRIAQTRTDEAQQLLMEARDRCVLLDAKPTLAEIDQLFDQLEQQAALRARRSSYPAGLTAREVDVLRLVAEGLSNAEVAERLYLSPRTVTSHLTSIYNKVGVGSRMAAARFAAQHGLL